MDSSVRTVRFLSRWLILPIISVCVLSSYLIAQTTVSAESSGFRVGLQSIVIPSPSPDLPETGPDYRVLAEPLAPASNRLVAAFLLPAELKAMQMRKLSLTHYALAEVPRQAEFSDASPAAFKQVSDAMAEQFGAKLDATIEQQQKEIDLKLKALGGKSAVTLEKPTMLGTLFSKADAIGYGAIIPVSVDGKILTAAMCMAILRVRQRFLFIYVYAPYTEEESMKSVQKICDLWSAAILKANSQ
jgi:hypothetical protein